MYTHVPLTCAGDQLKFSAKSSVLAQDWVVRIREAVAEVEEMERREVSVFSHSNVNVQCLLRVLCLNLEFSHKQT